MNTEELKRLATELVPWGATASWPDEINEGAAVVGHIDEDGNKNDVAVVDLAQYDGFEGDSEKMAAFYAAANPAAVLSLIAEIEQLRDQVNGLTGTADRAEKQRDELLAALKECRFALEPYDDIKPRDWKTDRVNLMKAHQSALVAIAKAEE